MKKAKGLIWGVVIIALGVIWGINEIGIASIDIFFDGWWTLFIIIPSLIGVFTDKNKTGSIIGLTVGCALLASRYVDLSKYEDYVFPAVVVAVGIVIVANTLLPKRKKDADGFNTTVTQAQPMQDNGQRQEYFATFSGQNFVFNDDFAGGDFTAAFGGIKIDLRNARIVPNSVINANATFGGIDILVPPNINVVSKSNSLFGGVTDKTNKNLPPELPTLFVNSQNIFGGTDIK
ncbi:MAG: LiaF transmembrane domain-containing protein [Eubacterium sp.]